jgi:predicted enzyme related to lactoylglutathione lyase
MTKKYPFTFTEPLNAIISMDVNDLERAIKFYTEILGFELSFLDAKEYGWVELSSYVDGLMVGLSQTEIKIKPSSTVFMMNVEDSDKAKAYLDSKGVKTTEIRDVPNLVSLFEFFDSEGNMIQMAGKPRIKVS